MAFALDAVGRAVPIGRDCLQVVAPAGREARRRETAFAALVERHYAALLRYLTRQTGHPELAADLTQESFLAAYRAFAGLRVDACAEAWLYRIARNQLRMEWRRRRLRRLVSLDWLPDGAQALFPALRRADASGDCGERDRIQRALETLSPGLREALLLHDLGGFTGEEVARILGIQPAAARKRICRAEAAFRRAYGPISLPDAGRVAT